MIRIYVIMWYAHWGKGVQETFTDKNKAIQSFNLLCADPLNYKKTFQLYEADFELPEQAL